LTLWAYVHNIHRTRHPGHFPPTEAAQSRMLVQRKHHAWIRRNRTQRSGSDDRRRQGVLQPYGNRKRARTQTMARAPSRPRRSGDGNGSVRPWQRFRPGALCVWRVCGTCVRTLFRYHRGPVRSGGEGRAATAAGSDRRASRGAPQTTASNHRLNTTSRPAASHGHPMIRPWPGRGTNVMPERTEK